MIGIHLPAVMPRLSQGWGVPVFYYPGAPISSLSSVLPREGILQEWSSGAAAGSSPSSILCPVTHLKTLRSPLPLFHALQAQGDPDSILLSLRRECGPSCPGTRVLMPLHLCYSF